MPESSQQTNSLQRKFSSFILKKIISEPTHPTPFQKMYLNKLMYKCQIVLEPFP